MNKKPFNYVNRNNNNNDVFNIGYKTPLTNMLFDKFLQEKRNQYLLIPLYKIDEKQKNFCDKIVKRKLVEPTQCISTEMYNILEFEFKHPSLIYSNQDIKNTNTLLRIKELKNINNKDHCYCTLFFPSYDSNGKKKYSYLIGILIVAHMLKNCYHNYELKQQKIKGTKAKVICLVTPDVEEIVINIIKVYYDEVICVPYISWDNKNIDSEITNDKDKFIYINDVSDGELLKGHPYTKVMTKLHIFNKKLLPYKKIVLIDADLFPLQYYDSLFSIDCPAGCIEHRRTQDAYFGVDSWKNDRSMFFKHGDKINSLFTDIEQCFASDINASLLVVEPNNEIFKKILVDLKIGKYYNFNNVHKGCWLGNNFSKSYLLPEQNYLTKYFSGQWHSIDMGFSSWLMDLDTSFGFTFPGFVVKPWSHQSAYHRISTNPYSVFSAINNKQTERSMGYQLLNKYLIKIIKNVFKNLNKEKADYMYNLFADLNIVMDAFDPWDPEYNISSSSVKLINIDQYNLLKLSLDQKQILTELWNYKDCPLLTDTFSKNDYLKILIMYDVKLYNMCYELVNPHTTVLLYDLLKNINIIEKNIVLFNNKFSRIKTLDLTTDHFELLLITNTTNYESKIKRLLKKLLIKGLRVYIFLKNYKFVQLFGDIVPFYYNITPENIRQTNYKDINEIDDEFINNILHFNISHHEPFILEYYNKHHVKPTNRMYVSYDKNYSFKHPWIDVTFAKCINNEIIINKNNNKINPTNCEYKKIFIKAINKNINSLTNFEVVEKNKLNSLFYKFIENETCKLYDSIFSLKS